MSEVLILIDLISWLLQVQTVPCAVSPFLAADGSPMVCSKQVMNLQWQSQGHTFTSTMGILPLQCFDVILGQDWLEACSHMWVHWSKKFSASSVRILQVCFQWIR